MFRVGDHAYVDLLQMPGGPCNDIKQVLLQVCRLRDLRRTFLIGRDREERWDFDTAVTHFIQLYRNNTLPDCFLDKDRLLFRS